MSDTQVASLVKTLLEMEIIKALNNSPEAIEKLVKAALSKEVDHNGKFDGYGSNKMPYLDYLVGEEIRRAACDGVRIVVQEQKDKITDLIRKGLSSDSVVAAVTNAFIGTAANDWQINVTFDTKKER